MKKISKANGKKFVTKVKAILTKLGAANKERYPKQSEKNTWLLQTFAGPLWLTLPEEQSTCYTLFARFENVEKAVGWMPLDNNLNRFSGKWNFHMTDLDHALEYIEDRLEGIACESQTIRAEIHSDDRIVERTFNAIPWFEQAKDKDILALAACGWGRDYPADAVGQFMAEKDKGCEDVFTYLALVADKKDAPGFEVTINEDDALAWLKESDPELHEKVLKSMQEAE